MKSYVCWTDKLSHNLNRSNFRTNWIDPVLKLQMHLKSHNYSDF